MRAREGEALEAILRGTLDRLAAATASVAELRPEIEQRYQERLAQRLDRGHRRRSSTSSECLRKWLCSWSAATFSEELARMDDAHRAFSRAAERRRRSRQETRLSAAGDESRGQHAAFEDRRREREGNAHYRAWAGHEGGDRKSAGADSERGIRTGNRELKLKQLTKGNESIRGRNSFYHFGAVGLGKKHAGERAAQAGERRRFRGFVDHARAARIGRERARIPLHHARRV